MNTSFPIPDRVRPRAVLVGIQLPELSDEQVAASLDELSRLCKTLGLDPVARLTQRRPSTGTATVLGVGKLRELARLTGGPGGVPSPVPAWRQKHRGEDEHTETTDHPDDSNDAANEPDDDEKTRAEVVVFDHELTPTQLRNLSGATGAQVLDRTTVILQIFQRHARTREARTQVEIASLRYLTPRLRATGGNQNRARGGIAMRGGAGESAAELDRRHVRDRIAELERELADMDHEVTKRRDRRGVTCTVSLVGYTNAGKSTLMRALTGAAVLVDDRLFATLDTTVRALHPETVPRILVSDTVGFVDRLPHDLVASFRSTLAEARDAELLLHVVDASDPLYLERVEVTRRVLSELAVGDAPELLVLNKTDRVDTERCERLTAQHPDAIAVSALDRDDVSKLCDRIVRRLEETMVDASLFVPYRTPQLLHVIRQRARVVSETHGNEGTQLTVRAPAAVIDQLRAATTS